MSRTSDYITWAGMLATVATALTSLGMAAHIGSERVNARILPYELGGLPKPFMTQVCDVDSDGTADRVQLWSVGPGYTNLQIRDPSQFEVDWYTEELAKEQTETP